ncbi:extracellular solute-binding protein [Brevibacillus centrosporus]|jgi:iron(III) transport system substrate-binding protein|uniref:extracellular solute-binding protein n=1 Tax=Brevibacillus centrosporus TaxID=54910 RepID=UPI0039879737
MIRKTMGNKLALFTLLVSTTLVFAGCGQSPSGQNASGASGSSATATSNQTEAASKPAASEPASSADSKSSEPLVVYLNDFDEIIAPMFEKETGYKLKVVAGNGAEIMSRIEAEKGNPHWDVVWMDAMPSIHQLGKNGQLLEGWTPKNAENLTDTYQKIVPANKTYYPTGAHAASVLIYNTKAVSADKAPKSWDDLVKPEFANLLGMADPAVAAPAYPFVAWFFEQRGMEGGKAYFDQILKNGTHVYPKNPNVAKALTGGEIKAAALQESNAYGMKNDKAQVEIVWPQEGAPASVRVAGIQKDTKNVEAAKAFVEFILDPKVQQELIDKGEESYFEPSAKGVKPKSDRAAEAKLVVADPEWAAEHEAEIKQWFADKAVK